MPTTNFDYSNVNPQFEDISSQITAYRSGDTDFSVTAYRFGVFVFGQLRMTAGSDLASGKNFAQGFPKPDSNGTNLNIVACNMSVNGNNGAKWCYIRTTEGRAVTGGGNATIVSGSSIMMTFAYVAE